LAGAPDAARSAAAGSSPGAGRYVQLNVITPTQGTNTVTRIYELEVYA
jgi:hypothetical protein